MICLRKFHPHNQALQCPRRRHLNGKRSIYPFIYLLLLLLMLPISGELETLHTNGSALVAACQQHAETSRTHAGYQRLASAHFCRAVEAPTRALLDFAAAAVALQKVTAPNVETLVLQLVVLRVSVELVQSNDAALRESRILKRASAVARSNGCECANCEMQRLAMQGTLRGHLAMIAAYTEIKGCEGRVT